MQGQSPYALDPCLGGWDGFPPILGQPAASSKPREGAFDGPSARNGLEAPRFNGALDNFIIIQLKIGMNHITMK